MPIVSKTTEKGISNAFLKKFKRDYLGMVYIMPMVLGILFFTLVPLVTSLYYSFHEFQINTGVVGKLTLSNFTSIFTQYRSEFFGSIGVTFSYALISIPMGMVLSFALAMFLNQKVKGIKFFRTLYYLPVLIPAVAGGLLWNDMTNVDRGYFNLILETVGLPKASFYSQNDTTLPTLLFMSLFNLGGGMILWIAQLKAIPDAMYEAARIEGAGFFSRTFKITVPMCTPIIFYNLIMNIISVLQTFSGVYLLRNGLNKNALNFIVVYIYETAFYKFDMGLACALSWMLFLVIASLTGIIFKRSKWVFYGESV